MTPDYAGYTGGYGASAAGAAAPAPETVTPAEPAQLRAGTVAVYHVADATGGPGYDQFVVVTGHDGDGNDLGVTVGDSTRTAAFPPGVLTPVS